VAESLPQNILFLRAVLTDCVLCPQRCHVDRTAGQRGQCGCGVMARLASAGPHFGEEPVLVGRGGSGTIFLSGCNLHCLFCQNYDISQSAAGREVWPAELAATAMGLEQAGCENINFVSPTHVAHAVAEAVVLARREGLRVPVVYNCGGYEAVETLRCLEGLIEIYMPDFKYADAQAGRRYSGCEDYPAAASAALAEMYRQAGPLEIGSDGVARRGMLVRHLVLPHDIARSREVIDTVARVAPGCAINVMAQYHGAWRAEQYAELLDRPAPSEVSALRDHAAALGLVLVH